MSHLTSMPIYLWVVQKKLELELCQQTSGGANIFLVMSTLKTSPLSQGSSKSSISSLYMLSSYLICRAKCFSTIYNAFFKARNCWKHLFWRLFFRDEEPFSPAAVSSPRPAKFLDTRKDQLQLISPSRIGMKVSFAFS